MVPIPIDGGEWSARHFHFPAKKEKTIMFPSARVVLGGFGSITVAFFRSTTLILVIFSCDFVGIIQNLNFKR
jgi:ABC-type amino acid transport system permease subunit